MKTSILIVTYLKDRPYLELNLRSIQKFATGFHDVAVLVPQEEYDGFKDLTGRYQISLVYYPRSCPPNKWHLMHQLQKCRADSWCPDADFVLHTDSDCMFIEPVTPEDYFVAGNPVMVYTEYSRLKEKVPWQPIVTAALKNRVSHEFMRRHPQVNPIGVYPALRDHIDKVHHTQFDHFVMSRKPDFPWGFTEHNVIGAFAFSDPEFHKQYHWHDTTEYGMPKEKLIQFWSHSPVDKPQEVAHGGMYTPAEFAERILA
jgi:hypothetical protein